MTTEKMVEIAVEAGEKLAWSVAGIVAFGAWENRIRLWNAAMCAGPFRFRSVRISASYLIRICIDGKYLVIRGGKLRDQFQPVGGVYKYMPHAKSRLEDLQVRPDQSFAPDKDTPDDLRIRLPGKHVPTLLRWFDKSRDRECNPTREFFEELVDPGLIDGTKFPFAQFRYVKRVERRLRWSPELRVWEILVFDVFELVPTPDQQIEFRRLAGTPGPDHAFVPESRLRVRGFQPGAYPEERVAPTAEWML